MEKYVIKNKFYRLAGIVFISSGAYYLIWLASHLNFEAKVISLPFFFCQLFTFLLVILSIRNHWNIKYRTNRPALHPNPPPVAIVITTYKEPVDIVSKTLNSVLQLSYPSETVIIISNDDKDVRQKKVLESLVSNVQKNNIFLLHTLPHEDAKAGNLNQAISFLRAHFPNIDLVLTQDADEIVYPDLLLATIGYFNNPNVAYVQTVKQSKVSKFDPFGNHDMMWYARTAPSREADNAMFACGSGVVWRISALESIGGFSTWNLVEDLTTSYNLLAEGWDSRYHFEALSCGLAPEDLPNFIKQRSTWAMDSLRIFFWDNPIFKSGLTISQKLHFLETPIFYLNGLAVVTLVIITSISLLVEKWPTTVDALTHMKYLSLSFLSLEIYFLLNNGAISYTRVRQFWIGLSPNFVASALKALFLGPKRKPIYKVTKKINKYDNYLKFVLPQIMILTLVFLSLAKVVLSTPLYSGFDWAAMFWGFYQASFFFQIIKVSWWKYKPKVNVQVLVKGLIKDSHGEIYPTRPSLNINYDNNA